MSSRKTGSSVSKAIHRKSELAPQQSQMVPDRGPNVNPVNLDNFDDAQLGPGDIAEQYPTSANQINDPRDAKYQLLEQIRPDPNTADTPYGRIQWSDDVFDWLQKKKQVTEKAKFEEWFAAHFDKMSPTAKALAKELYPSFYRDRMKTLKMNVKLLEKLAAIRIRGVQSKDDLMLQFAADQGYIDTINIINILHPETHDREERAQEYKRGLFNPRRYMFGESGKLTAHDNSSVFHLRDPAFEDENEHSGLLTGLDRDMATASTHNEWIGM